MERGERCECPEGVCVKGVVPTADCVMRLDGTVEAARCAKCEGDTWHHNGECVKCALEARDKTIPPQKAVLSPTRATPAGLSGLTLTIKCGNEFQVTDKRQVARILKILLEDK